MDAIGFLESVHDRVFSPVDTIAVLGKALADLPPSPRVMDFGGGKGVVARRLLKLVPGEYVVADVSRPALRKVPKKRGLASVLIPTSGSLPFASASFDGIILRYVLHHVPEREETLAELARLLRPGGCLHVLDYDPHRLTTKLFRLMGRVLHGYHCKFWDEEEVSQVLQESGMTTTQQRLDSLRFLVSGAKG